MGIYQCDKCGCIENTALGWYHLRKLEDSPDTRALCSACGPTHYKNGERTHLNGQWHGKFKREYFPLGTLVETRDGGLAVTTDEYIDLKNSYLNLGQQHKNILDRVEYLKNNLDSILLK